MGISATTSLYPEGEEDVDKIIFKDADHFNHNHNNWHWYVFKIPSQPEELALIYGM